MNKWAKNLKKCNWKLKNWNSTMLMHFPFTFSTNWLSTMLIIMHIGSPFFKQTTPMSNFTVIHNTGTINLTELTVNFCSSIVFCASLNHILAWTSQLMELLIMTLIINCSNSAQNISMNKTQQCSASELHYTMVHVHPHSPLPPWVKTNGPYFVDTPHTYLHSRTHSRWQVANAPS